MKSLPSIGQIDREQSGIFIACGCEREFKRSMSFALHAKKGTRLHIERCPRLLTKIGLFHSPARRSGVAEMQAISVVDSPQRRSYRAHII